MRKQPGSTQEEVAEQVEVSPDTVAGWETGRRPLTAVPVGQMLVHRRRRVQPGTAPPLLRVLRALEPALEADLVLIERAR
ncbi:helix-turn-helix domain-containing protein [Streptomyces pluripotens]|uniref:helix-turn-helix domain-containing protein n=1 Tax=Streptomyces pluripotens TaxID=1355015 RepID=UPI001F36E6F4|nr:helix-turn-helix transcriptional regulator [Streptomyces pluripotens]